MQIPVLVERLKGNGYRARGKDPFAISAKGATREEALAKLRAKIQADPSALDGPARRPHARSLSRR